MSVFSFFMTFARIGVVLLAVSATVPSFAQDLRFGIMFGDERSDFFGGQPPESRRGDALCKTQWQVRQTFAQRGYSDIFLNVMHETNVQVRATQDGVVYLIDYNFCLDEIEGKQALRSAR